MDPFSSIASAARGLRSGAFSAVELTQACLDRIQAIDGAIHSFITVTPEPALEAARQADEELAQLEDRGMLHGIPVAVKDLFRTAGVRTTAHSRVLMDWVPSEDATLVARLKDAGGIMLGKLAMHEFADGGPADDPFPAARNPWNLEYIPGGSSSGSAAALAAGLCFGALGSDTGFSLRGPSAFCGIAGLKPTYGRLSRHGVIPLSKSLDHAGPMGRTAEDCAILLQAIAGHDPKDVSSAHTPVPDYTGDLGRPVKGMRLGIPRGWLREGNGLDGEIASALESALGELAKLGCEITDVESEPFIAATPVHRIIRLTEAYAYHELTLMTRPKDLGSSLRARIIDGAALSVQEYASALQDKAAITERALKIISGVDALVLPISPRPVPTFDTRTLDNFYAPPSLANPFNLTGFPAMCVPCGFDSNGLPIGLQIAGAPFGEAKVLQIAYAYEQAMPWKDRHPEL